MFENIGGKIKTVAKIICWIGILVAVVVGIALMSTDEDMIVVGLLVMVAGSLFSWIGSFMAYGYGEIIEKLCDIERNTRKEENQARTRRYNFAPVSKDPPAPVKRWKCHCGNEVLFFPCPYCGEETPDRATEVLGKPDTEIASNTTTWECKKCGAHNASQNMCCTTCGTYK